MTLKPAEVMAVHAEPYAAAYPHVIVACPTVTFSVVTPLTFLRAARTF
jgi:hypothetical protein